MTMQAPTYAWPNAMRLPLKDGDWKERYRTRYTLLARMPHKTTDSSKLPSNPNASSSSEVGFAIVICLSDVVRSPYRTAPANVHIMKRLCIEPPERWKSQSRSEVRKSWLRQEARHNALTKKLEACSWGHLVIIRTPRVRQNQRADGRGTPLVANSIRWLHYAKQTVLICPV